LNLHVRNEKWENEIHLLIFIVCMNIIKFGTFQNDGKMKFNEHWRRQVYEFFKKKLQMKNEKINNEQHEEMKNKKHELKINR
jgi:hypothetical protein